MATSPQFVGVDTAAVKEATKNNYKSVTNSSFDDKLYSMSSDSLYYFGPAISSAVSEAQGSSSSGAMITDVAINAAVSGSSGLSTSLDSSIAAYTTGGGYTGSSLSTSLGDSSSLTFDPYATASSTDASSSDYETFYADMQQSNTEYLVLQSSIQQESTRISMLSTMLKVQHDTASRQIQNTA